MLPFSFISEHGAEKRRSRFSLRSLRFSGFSDTLCGSRYDDKLLFVHSVQHPVNMFPALTPAAQLVRVEKFIHGNIKKGNELVKGVETGVLAPVLNIMMERGVRSTSWARCSCVQPLAFRLRLISWPRA